MGRLITTTAVPTGFPLSQFNVPTATSNTVSVWLAIPVREAISPKANRTISICLIGIISRRSRSLVYLMPEPSPEVAAGLLTALRRTW